MIAQPLLDCLSRLDECQKIAATAEGNCVVTAGAGAGKTTVLASRYIHLVIEKGIPVRSILALTFTRKAAAEMYERIYGELAAQTSPWARAQLDDFQNAHITTLDSFCAEIVRQSTGDFGYSPDFAIDDEKCADLAQGLAYRFVLRNRDKPGVREMLLSFPFDAVAARLFGDIGAAHVTPIALFEKTFSPMKESLKSMAAEKAGAAIRHLAALAEEIAGISKDVTAPKNDCAAAIACAQAFIETRGLIESHNFIETRGLTEARSAEHAGPPALAPLSERFAAFVGLMMRSYGKNEAEQAIKALAVEAREEARNLLEFVEYEQAFPSHCSLLERLDEYAAEVAEAKRLADLMNFKDLGACAIRALERRKDLRSFWKNKIQSIMIDEFQDNNEQQKTLLYLLAEKKDRASEGVPQPADLEEGKLFFVGDEKQSIYRFRGADVAVFKRLSADLSTGKTADKPASVALTSNYRSSVQLIHFFNDFFPSVMADGEEGNEGSDFRASYSEMVPGKSSEDMEAPFDSKIRYYLVEAETDDQSESDESEEEESGPIEGKPNSERLGADDSLAFEVAQFIKQAHGNLELRSGKSPARGETKKTADYGDFAILLRTTTHQHRLEKYLRLLDIPFDSESPRSLFKESPANDIYNILTFAQDPANKAAYAALLRSPLCRISDEGFLQLMTTDKAAFELVLDSDRDARMLARAKSFFKALESMAKVAAVSDIIDYAWNYGGLRLDIMSRPESHPFLEHFDYIYHIAAGIDQNHGGIADFLSAIRPYIKGDTEKLDIENVPRSSSSGVKILTTHKAKGLQFPVVIIPWVENAGSTKRGQTLWEMLPAGLAVDIKPYDKPGAKAGNLFYKLAKSLNDEMARAELKRLLYVACTRAEDHLFFFGKKAKKEDPSGNSFQYYLEKHGNRQAKRKDGDSCLEDLGGRVDSDEDRPLLEKFCIPCRTIEEVRHWHKNRATPPVEAFARAYAAANPLDRTYPRCHLNATELNEIDLAIHGRRREDTGSIGEPPPISPDKFGTLCHHAVEQAAAFSSLAGYVPPDELVRGEDSAKAAIAVALATTMAANFLASDFWTCLPAQAQKKTEKPFLLALGDYIIKGRMDLFIETESEVTVIDFKSDLAQNPALYSVQMELYRRAAEGIAFSKKARVALYWLRTSSLTWMETTDITTEALIELAAITAQSIGHDHA